MECIRIWREAKMRKRGNEKCLEVVGFLAWAGGVGVSNFRGTCG